MADARPDEPARGQAPPRPSCAVCGSPIVLADAASPKGPRCPSHRDAEVIGAPAAPVPLRIGLPYPVFRINRVIAVNDGPVLFVDGVELLAARVEGGELLLTVRSYDADGEPALEILDNRWLRGDPARFATSSDGTTLRITDGDAVVVDLDTAPTPLRFSADLRASGVTVGVRPGSLRIDGSAITYRSPTVPDDGYAGCVVVVDSEQRSAELLPDPRHGGHAMTLTERDPIRRVTIALNAMAGLQAHIDAGPE